MLLKLVLTLLLSFLRFHRAHATGASDPDGPTSIDGRFYSSNLFVLQESVGFDPAQLTQPTVLLWYSTPMDESTGKPSQDSNGALINRGNRPGPRSGNGNAAGPGYRDKLLRIPLKFRQLDNHHMYHSESRLQPRPQHMKAARIVFGMSSVKCYLGRTDSEGRHRVATLWPGRTVEFENPYEDGAMLAIVCASDRISTLNDFI